MNELVLFGQSIQKMSESAIEKVRNIEAISLCLEQVKIPTRHVFHAGIYSRSITIPAGIVLTGAYITTPTLLIVCGHAMVFCGDEWIEINGFQVVPASAGRKQAFAALSDTHLTMSFATNSKSVEEAEEEFTNEAELLMSRQGGAENFVNITGE